MKFKVVGGEHIQKDSDGVSRKYSTGDVVESNVDLTTKLRNKFVRVFDNEPVTDVSHKTKADPTNADAWGDLDKMTLSDLKTVASEEEIDLKGAKTREDALRIIKASLVGAK